MINLKSFGKSLAYAAKGVWRVARTEQNFRIECVAAVAVVVAMYWLGLSGMEKAVLTLAIALVLVLELMNSIFERLVDLLKPRIHHYVEEIKDIMAGSVLVAAVGAAAIGFFVFWPYLLKLLG